MLKEGPLLPYYFETIYFNAREKEAWDWYTQTLAFTAFFGDNLYGFNRLGEFRKVSYTNELTDCDRGRWVEYKGTLCVDREELRYYA